MESKYYKWSKNKMKMIINSGYKEFDRQTNCISNGNIIANTMYGNYIRAWDDTINPVGNIVPKGYLFNYDLKYFNIDNTIRDYIRALNKQVILYELFTYNRNGKKNLIGWLIEDNGIIINMFVENGYGKSYVKRYLALQTVKNIIEEKERYKNEKNN